MYVEDQTFPTYNPLLFYKNKQKLKWQLQFPQKLVK